MICYVLFVSFEWKFPELLNSPASESSQSIITSPNIITRYQSPLAILLDTKGPEIRSGFFANDAKKIELVKGETLTLTTDYAFKGDKTKLACSYKALPTSVTVGQQILVADGSLVLTVLSCDKAAGEVQCRIENNASIGERKNMNLPGVIVDLPTLTEKDVHDIKDWGVKNNVDFIAASFVRKASDVIQIREVLGDAGKESILSARLKIWKDWKIMIPFWMLQMVSW